MANIASTDVTVTCLPTDVQIVGKTRLSKVTLTFGDGALTYPSGGVPLPAIAAFGMVRNLESLVPFDGGGGILWKFDSTNRTLKGYVQGVTVSAAGSATTDDYKLNSTNDATIGSEISVALSNDAGAGTYYTGQLKELGASASKIPAQTLICTARGW